MAKKKKSPAMKTEPEPFDNEWLGLKLPVLFELKDCRPRIVGKASIPTARCLTSGAVRCRRSSACLSSTKTTGTSPVLFV